jgi:hypothetical protein
MDMILFQSVLVGAIASPVPPEHGREGFPVAYFAARQQQRVWQAPETGSLGRTSVAVIACPFKFRP